MDSELFFTGIEIIQKVDKNPVQTAEPLQIWSGFLRFTAFTSTTFSEKSTKYENNHHRRKGHGWQRRAASGD
ncbi:MAG: hypothetical protein AAGF85_03145 [Bacteroidota bacterium]